MNAINDSMKNTQTGFTLPELMITLLVASIVMTVAIPSFQDFIMKNRLTTQINQFITSINLARSEAIKRGETITLCSSNDQSTCTASTWESGWIVKDSSDEVLRVYDSLSGDNALSNADSLTSISFRADGFFSGTSTTFTLCSNGVSGEQGRQIMINATGRPNLVSPNPTCS